jgi:hypothetical protein
MTYQITDMGNGTHQIQVSFFDEGVELEGETTVKGTPEDAERYVSVFERDLRINYAHLFPQPEPEEEGELDDEIY